MTTSTMTLFKQERGLALGTASLARAEHDPVDNARAVVNDAWDRGVRYFDTAPMYGGGVAETLFGAAIAGRERDQYAVSTKVGRLVRQGEPVLPLESELWRYDFSRSGIRRSMEESLERLGLDRIDIAYIHDPDAFLDQAVHESYAELRAMRDEGIIGAIGVGITKADLLADLMERIDLDAAILAGRMSLIDPSALERVLPLVREQGVALVVAAALHGGLVDGVNPPDFHYSPTPPHIRERVARIAEVAARHGVALPALAFAWVLAYPEVAMVLTGPADTSQVASNWQWATADVPPTVWHELDESGLLPARRPAALAFD